MNEIIIQARIVDDKAFAILCLMKLYEQQELDEQTVQSTMHTNKRGFNKPDSLILSSIAEKCKASEGLTLSDWIFVQRLLPKYAAQLSTLLTQTEIEF